MGVKIDWVRLWDEFANKINYKDNYYLKRNKTNLI